MFVLACLQYSHTHSAAAAATHNHTATCSGITDEAEIYNMEMLHFQQMRLKKKKKRLFSLRFVRYQVELIAAHVLPFAPM